MDKTSPKHEKIRFRRGDHHRLEKLPSAIYQVPHRILKLRGKSRFVRTIAGTVFTVLALIILAGIGLYAIGASGLGKERIRVAAQSALTQLAGENILADFDEAKFALSGSNLLALELSKVRISSGSLQKRNVSADGVKLGLAIFPLLRGQLKVSGAILSGVQVNSGTSIEDESLFPIQVKNHLGLVEPDLVLKESFRAAADLLGSSSSNFTGTIRIDDLMISAVDRSDLPRIGVNKATVSINHNRIDFDATGDIEGTEFELSVNVRRDRDDEPISFDAKIDLEQLDWEVGQGRVETDLAVSVTGTDRGEYSAGNIRAEIALPKLRYVSGQGEIHESRHEIAALIAEESKKIEFESVRSTMGGTEFNFHGAIGPAPAASNGNAVYRYEFVSDGSTISPSDSPEPPLSILARIAGIIDPSEKRVTADDFGLRTTHGEILGNGALVFVKDKTPAAFLAITVPEMPVAHAKQLWPWKAADGARTWVLDNVFGGMVRNSHLELSLVADRFGDGEPFRADEIFGHFEIYETRFDVAGEIPPVRDATGIVDFHGPEVKISMSSGTVFLPSGRIVDATNGLLDIQVAPNVFLTGELDIDVAGDADSIVELASFKPIDADTYVDFEPEAFSGRVAGHVRGIIPLEPGSAETDDLNFDVSLDFVDLSIGRPFAGNILSNATGTLIVNPEKAVIETRGLLNGIPAEISLVEPLKEGGPATPRKIRLEMDDAARAKVLPGLNAIMTGKIKVDILTSESGPSLISADLTAAALDVPWAGWKKGAEVPAEVSFAMETSEDRAELSDIEFSGESFSLKGSATVIDGAISKASFHDVRLNRDDSFKLTINSGSKGFLVNLSGEKIDARSVIRQFLTGPGFAESGFAEVPVSLVAKARSVLGFGEETVSNLEISYSGSTKRMSGLDISAVTKTGKPFTVRTENDGVERAVKMQSADAGSILRFLDLYSRMEGGSIDLRLAGPANGPLTGQIDARDFWIVNEPRLQSLVSSAPDGGNRSLNQVVRRDIDVSRAKFERGFSQVEKGRNYLNISDGVLRGPLIGSTFQGVLYDADGNISITGTFMPAYGLNRMFAEIPLVGLILGNGRDRGLIGITYKLSGDAKSPKLQVNPISIMAPGIFRSIFEFR